MRVLALLLASLFAAAPACARIRDEAFYKGRTVRDCDRHRAGRRSYDLYGRLLAHYLTSTSPAIRPSSSRTGPAPATCV